MLGRVVDSKNRWSIWILFRQVSRVLVSELMSKIPTFDDIESIATDGSDK
jgi:hypothetical protein